MNAFNQLGLSQPIIEAIEALGFTEPTPIQSQAIPQLLTGEQDMVGLAQTGTGKTAAFGLPLIELVDQDRRETQALVLAPTRELCLQITGDLESFAKYQKKLRVTPVYGGTDIIRQIKEVKQGVQVIVATPGRLRDLIRRKAVNLETIQYVVLDEADEMLNMGFKEEIDDILSHTPEEKHTWLFSATMPPEVRRISKEYMVDPFELSVNPKDKVNTDIDHQYLIARPNDRYEILRRFLDLDRNMYALVFCRTRKGTQELADQMGKDGYNADALHGELSQKQRDYVMNRFRTRKIDILVATDVAARGLDVNDITHVFHFHMPDDLAYYTHRSGRTGRAGRKGISLLFAHPKETGLLKRMERSLRLEFTKAHIPTGEEICQQQLLSHIHEVRDAEVPGSLDPFLPAIMEAIGDLSREEIIKRMAALSFGNILETYGDAPDLNQKRRPRQTDGNFKRLFINVGRMDLQGKGDFIGMICEHANITGEDIGKIYMKPTHTLFEVNEERARRVIKAFKNSFMDRRRIRVHLDDEGSRRNRRKSKEGHKRKKRS